MDTVEEENSLEQPFLYAPEIRVDLANDIDNNESAKHIQSAQSSRRSSESEHRKTSILAALRRPSQSVALYVAHAVMDHTKFMKRQKERSDESENDENLRRYNRHLGNDALTAVLSALYGKLLVVLGIAFPTTEIISYEVRPFFYQGFYLYLYLGTILYIAFMYTNLIKRNTNFPIIGRNKVQTENASNADKHDHSTRYGSFYLRLGAIAFGIGNMVYSGLEFGRYFEIRNNQNCDANILQATTPALRMVLTIVQIQFIFLNSKELEMDRYKIISRFGLMHMIGTNLCEWLYVLVEETKHEIIHLADYSNSTLYFNGKYCAENEIMASLVAKASSFLFPCTIEYSLICAVILFEMWKNIKHKPEANMDSSKVTSPRHINLNYIVNPHKRSGHHFTLDCSNSHKGLFFGIIVIVLTIISLIMFFVLANDDKLFNKNVAEFEVNIVELVLYIITTISVICAMVQLRDFKYEVKNNKEGASGMRLDNMLLVVAQAGVFIYSIFSIIGSYFAQSGLGIAAEICSFIQTCLQTIFVLDGSWRHCITFERRRRMPGREIITFLIIANMAMWSINALEKNRAEFKPTHLKFFGDWAWTVITHVSMPLAIFYRFHSTICLFEIWKNAYKIKYPLRK